MNFLTHQDLMNQTWGNTDQPGLFCEHPNSKISINPPQGYRVHVYSGSDTRGIHVGFFSVVAYVHDENNENSGKLVKFANEMGYVDYIYVKNTQLLSGAAINAFTDKGFFIEDVSEIIDKFIRSIRRTKPDKFVPFASKAGYSKAFHAYVLPDGMITKDGQYVVQFDKKSGSLPLKTAGEYDLWKQNIASKCIQYPIPTFALIVALSAPLFPFVDLGTIFVHFFGLSSRGKTLLLQLAASVYGNGSDPRNSSDQSLISQWNATPTGLEGMAALYNGAIGLLDELHKCDDKHFPKAIYALNGGIEKARGKSNGALQEQKTWKFPALSCGEESGLEKIQRTKEEATLGRMLIA